VLVLQPLNAMRVSHSHPDDKDTDALQQKTSPFWLPKLGAHAAHGSEHRRVPRVAGISAAQQATGCGYRMIESLRSIALRRVFLARNKRDLVAVTEIPESSATSFSELSLA
jgi:hypothetical protein